ncbi:hypothetical protein [Mucilaginibacter jinjuensis]|uniref:Uncharacterized protein n=1 Tax=Mucilaginibacter jinjuensis TaxID=1176721 RepID=A0ABY7T4U7_9SPHI|nr:hypothetical protein [Mucilaginibacter jinjuensis]WCT11401.1 hypothetical protein PQO05_21925 [Mucilaginibacter jinjuensis]
MTKEKVMETVKDLPANFEFNVLLEKLIFIDGVEKGLEQIDKGNTLTHNQAKEQVKQWSK